MRLLRLLYRRPPPILPSIAAYALWADHYPPHAHNVLMQTEQIAMLDMLPDVSGRVVLDLACGTGRYSLLARARGASRVIGLDNSIAMLQRNPITSIALSTTEAIPLSAESVDVVLCGLALGHLLRLEPSLNEINRILKPGGIALLSDFHPFIALKGGQRTFTAPDGKTYAAEHHIHLYADYHRAASQSGLHIEHVAEPYLDAPGAPANRLPVVLVLRLRKPG